MEDFPPSTRSSYNSLPEETLNRLRSMIHDGTLEPGSRLPSEVELADAMGVSRGTIRAALHLLEQQGLIWRRHGIGTFVAEEPVLENRLDLNSGVTDVIRSMGRVPGTSFQEINGIPADEYLAERLRVAVENPLVQIRRTRTADGRPVVASIDIFAQQLLRHSPRPLDLQTLKETLNEELSVYRLLENHLQIVVDHGIAKVRPYSADADLIEEFELDLSVGAPMLYLEQLDYDRDQHPIIFSREYHVSEFSAFSIYRRR